MQEAFRTTATCDFADLLLDVLDRHASDLHLTAASKPMVRVRGRLTPLEDYPVLDATETREIVYSILSNDQRQRSHKLCCDQHPRDDSRIGHTL